MGKAIQQAVKSAFHKGNRTTSQPLISVITACFNAAGSLQNTIDSLSVQTDNRFEFIIVDGNSSDHTLDIIKANLDKIDFWISEPDRGMYDAMNKGASIARGTYLSFLNADDAYLKETINHVVTCAGFGDASVIHGNMIKVRDIDGQTYHREEFPNPSDMLRNMGVFHPSSFILASSFWKMDGYDTQYRLAADYNLFLGLWYKGENFQYINKPLAYFALGGLSNTGCGTYLEAVQMHKAHKTGNALRATRLLWKCRLKRISYRIVIFLANATGTQEWVRAKQKSRWA